MAFPEKIGLSGPRKAAILLTVLGEESATTVFKNLNEDDLQMVADEVSNLGQIPAELQLEVIEEYHRMTQAQDFLVQGGQDLARRLLIKAFGVVEAELVLQRLSKARQLDPKDRRTPRRRHFLVAFLRELDLDDVERREEVAKTLAVINANRDQMAVAVRVVHDVQILLLVVVVAFVILGYRRTGRLRRLAFLLGAHRGFSRERA